MLHSQAPVFFAKLPTTNANWNELKMEQTSTLRLPECVRRPCRM